MIKKKIIFRHRSMEMGGIEMVLLNILNYLNADKFEIVLFLNYRQGEFLPLVPKHVKIIALGEGVNHFSTNTIFKNFQKLKRRAKYSLFKIYPRAFYRKKNLLDFDYEVAFSHYMLRDVYHSPNKHSKKIYWIHGDLRNSGFSSKHNQDFVNYMVKFDSGVFVSNHGKNVVESNWNVKLENAFVIYNLLNIHEILKKSKEKINKTNKKLTFISVGRLFVAKGFTDLIEAHHRLIKEGYAITTKIIGDGIQRPELESLIEKYQLQESFFLHGFSHNPLRYVSNAEYFVLPSYSESYPIVIAEALCLQKPVLSTDVGGISEMIIPGVNGLLFKPGKDELYKVMKRLLDDKSLGEKFSHYNSLQEFQIKNEKIFKQLDHLFN